jgi:hypothetical protein
MCFAADSYLLFVNLVPWIVVDIKTPVHYELSCNIRLISHDTHVMPGENNTIWLYCSIFACNTEYYFRFVWIENFHLFYRGNQRERAPSVYILSRLTPNYRVEQQFVSWRPHLHCKLKPVPKAVILTLTLVWPSSARSWPLDGVIVV